MSEKTRRIPAIENLISAIKEKRNLPQEEELLLKKAYAFAQKSHTGQKRGTGEDYFIHPYETAMKLAEWNLDTQTIASGLLHDTVEDTAASSDDIKNNFGEEVAFIVEGVTKLGKLKYRGASDENKKEKLMAENLRKMILAISQDLRVVFVKLADRLHNMKTLDGVSPLKRKRIALETSDIYAPLAYRLGMQSVSGEMEDLAFPYLHPVEYRWIVSNIKEQYDQRVKYLEQVKPIMEEALKKNNIVPIKIDYRAKRISSLYKKLVKADMNLEQIYDLVAFRIIVRSVEECYASLGIVHQLWPPLPGRIKDYIALPKPNGYKSLHTTVFCLDKRITEFQIRTLEMHNEAENGIAAHWAYTQAKTTRDYLENKAIFADKSEIKWVQQLKSWQQEFTNSQEFLQSLKVDFFQDRVFAITPEGEVIDLPSGSTPVDFAYNIHTKIGDQCIGAKINGKIVSLNRQIQSGDLVEILTQKSKKPSESWLEFVKTGIAKRRIRASLKKNVNFLKGFHQTEIKITASDRIGLVKDISTILSRSKINILSLTVPKTQTLPVIKIVCDTTDKEKVEKLILKLKGVAGIKEINFKII